VWDLPGANIRDLVTLAGRWKVTPEALLDGLPVTFESLADPTTRVPLRICEAIVLRAHELTREPALAFYLGMEMRVSSHGFLGFAAMTASTARDAIELACRFAGTRTSAIGLALVVEGDTASIVIEERTPLGAMRELAVLTLIVGFWTLGRQLTGTMLDGAGECAFPEPPYARALPLGGRLRFGAPVHRMVFGSAILDLPLTTADAVATKLAKEQCERELLAISPGLSGRIRAQLTAKPAASLEDIAKHIHVSPRTLKRKLADEGTTFSAIRDDLRRQRALLLLDDRRLAIGEVATRLGYTELPNFTRAFRKWTGMTPAAYRDREKR
jgi:AraC-like DNA-binding protein